MTSPLLSDVASQREREIAARARLPHWEPTMSATTRRGDTRGRARFASRLRTLVTRR